MWCFVARDNNNVIATHYFKRLNSLIIVPTARAVLWITMHTRHSAPAAGAVFIYIPFQYNYKKININYTSSFHKQYCDQQIIGVTKHRTARTPHY